MKIHKKEKGHTWHGGPPLIKSTWPGNGRLLSFSSLSSAASLAASEVEMQSSTSPHFSMMALYHQTQTELLKEATGEWRHKSKQAP